MITVELSILDFFLVGLRMVKIAGVPEVHPELSVDDQTLQTMRKFLAEACQRSASTARRVVRLSVYGEIVQIRTAAFYQAAAERRRPDRG
jgi:hypothetical protein